MAGAVDEGSISGTGTDGLTWVLEGGTLTVSGDGPMHDYVEIQSGQSYITSAPWGSYASQIERVVISDGVTYIGKYAFADCEKITTVSIGEGVTSIGKDAFGYCSALKDVHLPDTLTTIGDAAFEECGSIEYFHIPDSVTSIGINTFGGWTSLKSLYISGNIKEELGGAMTGLWGRDFTISFYYPNWPDVTIDFGEGSPYEIEGGVLYNGTVAEAALDYDAETITIRDGTTEIEDVAFNFPFNAGTYYDQLWTTEDYSRRKTKEVILPSSVTIIGEMAFKNCPLETINLDNVKLIEQGAFIGTKIKEANLTHVTQIDYQAFSGCSQLETVTWPQNLQRLSLGDAGEVGSDSTASRAFEKCTNLQTVIISGSITDIPNRTFEGCTGLKTVVISDSVQSIGRNAFNGITGDASETTFIMRGTTPPDFNEKAFGSSKPTALNVLVPAAAKSAYTVDGYILKDFVTDNSVYALNLAPSTTMALASTSGTEGTANTLTLSGVTVPTGMTLTAESNHTDIATVSNADNTLTVTGLAAGEAVITAQLKVGDYVVLEDTCTVTVTAAGEVIPAVEEPQTALDASISSDEDKQTATTTASSVEANEAITTAANQEAAALNQNDSLRSQLIADGKSQLNTEGDVTLYTQTYLSIEATSISKGTGDQSSTVTSITLDITPMVRTVASTANNSADVTIKDEQNADGNAVVVQEAKALTINGPAEITVQLPDNFKSQLVYVEHQKNGRSCFYSAEADENGKLTFTSHNGFSPFTFSLTNSAVAQVNGIGYSSLQDAVNEAGVNDTVTILQNDLSANVTKDLTLKNGMSDAINVTINGRMIEIKGEDSYAYDYVAPSGGSSSSNRYTVSIASDIDNGSISVSPSRAERGDTVTITVTPDAGYELDTLTVKDASGNAINLTRKSDTTYTFEMPSGRVTVDATFAATSTTPSNPFTDVASNAYYADAVLWAVENDVTNGTSATTFSPNASCTRAQMVTFLWRASGSPEPQSTFNPFTDVASNAYYADAVLWAVENGITNGTSETTFSPDATVTRGQTVTFLYRDAGSPAASASGTFTDVAADAYYAAAVQWAVSEGVTNGMTSTTFQPNGDCTRAQIVTFLYRYLAV